MRRLKAAKRREQLLMVATKVFARYGYEAATTHIIADAAEITEPILYRHFKSKQELFVAITKQMSQQTLDHWRQLIAPATEAKEKVRLIAREFPEHLRRLSDAYRVIHGALATSRDRRVLAVMREHYLQIEDFFVSIIREGQQSGAFRRDMDPSVPAWELINTGIGYAMVVLNLSKFERFSVPDAVEFVLRGMTT
jgi:AcrR family transcriptional regulator